MFKKNLICPLTLCIILSFQVSEAQETFGALSPYFKALEKENLGKPYSGIITSEGKENHLFPIKSTGVSTQPIKEAAEAFLQSLSLPQRGRMLFDTDNIEWQNWANVDHGLYKRQGVSLKELTEDQKKLAFDFMQSALSVKGLELSKNIMKTDQTLREINNNNPIYDEELYFFTVMGTPSLTEPWGWQIDGHHLIINYFILGDQVVMTPTFMGGEPIVTTSGKYKGNVIFQDEQNMGLKFMTSLSKEQQKTATLTADKGRNNIAAEAFSDNKVVDYAGLPVSSMTSVQKEELLQLANQYISTMKEGHAEVKMEQIKKHLDRTYFAWIGQTNEEAVFYYRIHSPVVLIEFDHQAAIGIKSDSKGATRNHIHSIVRTPNGNDYGKDLLQQHLKEHHH